MTMTSVRSLILLYPWCSSGYCPPSDRSNRGLLWTGGRDGLTAGQLQRLELCGKVWIAQAVHQPRKVWQIYSMCQVVSSVMLSWTWEERQCYFPSSSPVLGVYYAAKMPLCLSLGFCSTLCGRTPSSFSCLFTGNSGQTWRSFPLTLPLSKSKLEAQWGFYWGYE